MFCFQFEFSKIIFFKDFLNHVSSFPSFETPEETNFLCWLGVDANRGRGGGATPPPLSLRGGGAWTTHPPPSPSHRTLPPPLAKQMLNKEDNHAFFVKHAEQSHRVNRQCVTVLHSNFSEPCSCLLCSNYGLLIRCFSFEGQISESEISRKIFCEVRIFWGQTFWLTHTNRQYPPPQLCPRPDSKWP